MTAPRLASILFVALALACGSAGPDDGSADDLSSARSSRCSSNAQCKSGMVCVNGRCTHPDAGVAGCTSMDQCGGGGLCESGSCVAMQCLHRASNKTGLRAAVQITRYQGIQHGSHGDHEIAYGTIAPSWVDVPSVIDTRSVQLAMNVASSTDPSGLPHEIKLSAGQSIEVEGEYISGATANAPGGVAVIHFTHATCGYATIAGTTYQ